ncbi:insulin receptor substrate 2-like isoform X2 [Nerophis lumbriciformis]|uniref:insulin receptor substrate 2-like isoform X2 n=1 Tax=Nerophis lumbriciformis TaxID=546530 RepID=UPI002AE03F73|nr:insulin receptor substrate 2-like isoform X2 [Nerophis lumbriciformis]
MASPPGAAGHLLLNGVKKCGDLRKHKHGHRRFFVLREPTENSPARLEYYDSEKKWRSKGAAKRVIGLDSCLCVNKRADAKNKHLIALYTKDEYFAVAADSEQDQESWYVVLTDLLAECRVYDSPASTSSLVGFEEASYGLVAPAAYKEVWQVNLKSRGLGQVKNLTGVFRLCLSSRTISFVKLNSETAAVCLQLMNIRRCGHSDSFFFIEVGRSAITGPGEFWMQAEDSVVAQNIHETILEAMKELSEFRPRSKSQSASTTPISVPSRRNLNNLPPSQTGLVRRSRTDSMAATSPGRKFTSCRVRTSSEGDGSVPWPVSTSMPVTASPTSSNSGVQLSRSHTLSSGRTCRMLESSSNLHHSLSVAMPNSPPCPSSPISVSPGYAGLSTPDKAGRPFSCSTSISGSLSDTTFILCDDYSCSPGEAKFLPLSCTDSLSSTPPSRNEGAGLDKAYRKRTHSLTTPPQQKVVTPLSSASLDEYMLMRLSGYGHNTTSPKVSYPEDYGDIEIGSSRSSSSNLGDDGYMPMTPGVTPLSGKVDNYVPMSPMCVSAPKQIVNPRVHPHGAASRGYKTSSPSSISLEDNGYMRMWCGSKSSMDSPDRHGEYMTMSPGNPPALQTPPDYYTGATAVEPTSVRAAYQSSSHTLPANVQASKNDEGSQYVLMSPQSSLRGGSDSDYYSMMQPAAAQALSQSPLTASPARHDWMENRPHRGRLGRPNRLPLDTIKTLPSMNEHPVPGKPNSPGEYINIDLEKNRFSLPSNESAEGRLSTLTSSDECSNRCCLTSYSKLELASHPLEEAEGIAADHLDTLPDLSMCPSSKEDGVYHLDEENRPRERNDVESDYTERTFGMNSSSPQLVPQGTTKYCQSGRERRHSLEELAVPEGIGVFLLEGASSSTLNPVGSAKVIRANPQGRRRHSSETFSSTATVTPVFPSFARGETGKRHSSVENISSRSSEGSDEEYGSPVNRSAGYPHGLNYISLNLLDGKCDELVGFKPASSCKGGVGGLHSTPYACLGFKEAATTAKD